MRRFEVDPAVGSRPAGSEGDGAAVLLDFDDDDCSHAGWQGSHSPGSIRLPFLLGPGSAFHNHQPTLLGMMDIFWWGLGVLSVFFSSGLSNKTFRPSIELTFSLC